MQSGAVSEIFTPPSWKHCPTAGVPFVVLPMTTVPDKGEAGLGAAIEAVPAHEDVKEFTVSVEPASCPWKDNCVSGAAGLYVPALIAIGALEVPTFAAIEDAQVSVYVGPAPCGAVGQAVGQPGMPGPAMTTVPLPVIAPAVVLVTLSVAVAPLAPLM
jgi:hypothetical protein